MPRKRTKKEALDRLQKAYDTTSELPKGGRRGSLAHEFAYMGAAGLIMLDPLNRLADERIVLPLDMVCIPAYQAYMIEGTPSLQIYVRAGETIIPTGGNVEDVRIAMESDEAMLSGDLDAQGYPGAPKKVRKPTAYQRQYKKAFKQVAPRYKKKDGTWKKDGFKAAVRAAHKKAKGGK